MLYEEHNKRALKFSSLEHKIIMSPFLWIYNVLHHTMFELSYLVFPMEPQTFFLEKFIWREN